MKHRPPWTILATVFALGMGAAAAPSAGQSPRPAAPASTAPAHLRGRVLDKRSRKPIPGAQVILDTDGRFATADSAGLYDVAGISHGLLDLSVRAHGFAVGHYSIQLIGQGSWDQDFELDSARTSEQPVRLAPVPVTATARTENYRLRDFEIRRRSGRGQFLTDEEIRASGAANIADAARNMRGVTLDCGGTMYGGCRIRMIGSPARCLPVYFVDGQMDNEFGPLTPIRDVIAMELYTGPADVPGDFAGTNAGCGVIALWTRSGPDRRRP